MQDRCLASITIHLDNVVLPGYIPLLKMNVSNKVRTDMKFLEKFFFKQVQVTLVLSSLGIV